MGKFSGGDKAHIVTVVVVIQLCIYFKSCTTVKWILRYFYFTVNYTLIFLSFKNDSRDQYANSENKSLKKHKGIGIKKYYPNYTEMVFFKNNV